jgi:hypothetical protein
MNTETFIIILLVFATAFTIVYIKNNTPNLPILIEFDNELKDLEGRIDKADEAKDYYTLIRYKFDLRDLRFKYGQDTIKPYTAKKCDKLEDTLTEKINDNTPVARKESRR